ncbi:E3 ubiquitin-protein ligase DCST1-like [Artemia franciscana]|uniref:E3 ubiquitin-protein ligase DCST1-like n=1 Tax=Artemia franciscana TaxID=6661 RepID=UPI0032D9F7C9
MDNYKQDVKKDDELLIEEPYRRTVCTILLLIPTLATSKGRTVLYALAVAALIAGPVTNLYKNASEASKSMACSQELIYNETTLLQDYSKRTFVDLATSVKESVETVGSAASDIRKSFGDVKSGVDVVVEGVNKARNFVTGAEKECMKGIDRASEACKGLVTKAYALCKTKLKLPPSLSAFDPIVSEVCNILDVGDRFCSGLNLTQLNDVCSSARGIDIPLSKEFIIAEKKFDEFSTFLDPDFDFLAQLEIDNNETRANANFFENVKRELDTVSVSVFKFLDVLKGLMTLALAAPIFDGWHYIGKYLKKITVEEEEEEKPIKKQLIPIFEKSLPTWVINVAVSGCVLATDYMVFWILDLIRRHGDIEYPSFGAKTLALNIVGDNIFSKVFEVLVGAFNNSESVQYDVNVKTCIPTPSPFNFMFPVVIGFIYILAVITMCVQPYAEKTKLSIVKKFYPDAQEIMDLNET